MTGRTEFHTEARRSTEARSDPAGRYAATCATDEPSAFLVDGRQLLNPNQNARAIKRIDTA